MKNKLFNFGYFILILLFAGKIIAIPADSAVGDQGLKLKKGDSFIFVISSEILNPGSVFNENKEKITTGFALKVIQIEKNGTVRFEAFYDSIAITAKGSDQSISYNSAHDYEALPDKLKPYEALLNQNFTIEIGIDGTILKVQGIDSVVYRMLDRIRFANPAGLENIKRKVISQLGDLVVKNRFALVIPGYPKEAITPGGTWQRLLKIKTPLAISLKNTWTLKELKARSAILQLQSIVNSKASSGSLKGGWEIDLSSGWPKKGSLKFSLKSRAGHGATSGYKMVTGKIWFEKK